MVRYVTGDLLEATQKVIVHGCNAQGVMGSGVARLIRARYPNVYEIYALKHKVFGLELGDIVPVATTDGRIIVNAITQEYFGGDGKRYVDYDAIETCIKKIDNRVQDWGVVEVAMPRIGAGLGGGDWDTIEAILHRSSKNFIPVIYDLPATR
jgi:O-acetyl-ADP-ribose deacetylase (regulator of RNase III)